MKLRGHILVKLDQDGPLADLAKTDLEFVKLANLF